MRRIMPMGTGGGANAALRALHQRCVGCETQGRPGRSGTANPAASTFGESTPAKPAEGSRHGDEWRTVRREPQAVVRSTLPEA